MNHEEIENLNRLITSNKITSVIKKRPQKTKVHDQMASLVGSTKHLKTEYQSFSNTPQKIKEGTLPNILGGQHYSDTKTRKGHLKKRKLQANIPDEDRYKYPQQNISKLNSTIHWKNHTPWLSGIHFRDARMVQQLYINGIDYINKMKYKNHMVNGMPGLLIQ